VYHFCLPPQHQQQEVISILSLDIFALPSHGRIENNRQSTIQSINPCFSLFFLPCFLLSLKTTSEMEQHRTWAPLLFLLLLACQGICPGSPAIFIFILFLMVPAHTRKLIVSLMEGQAAMSHSRFLREEEPLPSISSAAGVLGDASDGDEQAVLQQRELVRVQEVPQGAVCGGGWWVGGLVVG